MDHAKYLLSLWICVLFLPISKGQEIDANSFLEVYPSLARDDAEKASGLVNRAYREPESSPYLLSCLDLLVAHIETPTQEYSALGVRHLFDITATSAIVESNYTALGRLLDLSHTDSRLTNKATEIGFEFKKIEQSRQ